LLRRYPIFSTAQFLSRKGPPIFSNIYEDRKTCRGQNISF
jgi:hypothetical protein